MLEQYILEGLEYHINYSIPRYKELQEYYEGKHSILDRPDKLNKPNNKLVCSHPSKIVDTATAYFIGQPIVILEEDMETHDYLNTICRDNNFDDLLFEISKEGSIKGKSGLLVYQDELGNTKLIQVPAEEFFTVYDRLSNETVRVRVYTYTEVINEKIQEFYAVEIYSKDKIEYRVLKNDKLVPDLRHTNPDVKHIFGDIPLIEFKNNAELMGDFEKVLSLIDAYDKLMSDTSDEHEAFRNAYLMLKNLMIDPNDEMALRQGSILEVGTDGDVKFITKTIQDGAILTHLNKLQQDIHNFTDCPNMSDENFSGNASGVAMKFKLLGLENKCIIKENKFKGSLITLFKVINPVFNLKIGKIIDINNVKIQFTRNIPVNLTELADLVVKLDGIVDKETLLSLLPFIENPQVILDKLEEEIPVGKYTNPLPGENNNNGVINGTE